jgi:predicted dinucleotide-binding enzyme
MPESAWVSNELGRPVIKAFNNIYADHLLNKGQAKGTPGRIGLPVAGDDPKAKALVMQLVDEIGFDPVDAGTLAESWRQQPGSPVYATDHDAQGVQRTLARTNPCGRRTSPPRPRVRVRFSRRRKFDCYICLSVLISCWIAA